MTRSLTLAAQDTEDLQIISARLQDAVAKAKNLAWLPQTRRFAALFNRFEWEKVSGRKKTGSRVRAGLSFGCVLSAKSHNIHYGNPEAVLSLLAIRFTPRGSEDPGGIVELLFSGGGTVRLDVECIEASLSDVGESWAARGRPEHPLES
jgi:DUF2948 family protein